MPEGMDTATRFERLGWLIGDTGLARLARAHLMVVGVGGVGSWAAEALARSGVGRITLVDFDTVCVTNVNRQLHALDNAIGRPKAEVMAERLRAINPQATIRAHAQRYEPASADELLADAPDGLIDAIDSVTAKCHLLAQCRKRGIAAVCSTGAGGRSDPAAVAIGDLAHTDCDRLARVVRKVLRRHHGFPRTGAFGIPAVYSRELPQGDRDQRRGTSVCVTAVFGFHCAACAMRRVLAE
jgi:tRNA A37 threonylcarbamoyladenosine dehydratase